MPVTEVARIDRETSQWDEAFYAFLAEKERRSGSMRTVQSYSRMLQAFFAGVSKPPDKVNAQDAFDDASCRSPRKLMANETSPNPAALGTESSPGGALNDLVLHKKSHTPGERRLLDALLSSDVETPRLPA